MSSMLWTGNYPCASDLESRPELTRPRTIPSRPRQGQGLIVQGQGLGVQGEDQGLESQDQGHGQLASRILETKAVSSWTPSLMCIKSLLRTVHCQWHKKVWPWSDPNLVRGPTLARCGRSSHIQTWSTREVTNAWTSVAADSELSIIGRIWCDATILTRPSVGRADRLTPLRSERPRCIQCSAVKKLQQ